MSCCLPEEAEGLRGSGRKSQIQSHLLSMNHPARGESRSIVSSAHCSTSQAATGGRGVAGGCLPPGEEEVREEGLGGVVEFFQSDQ